MVRRTRRNRPPPLRQFPPSPARTRPAPPLSRGCRDSASERVTSLPRPPARPRSSRRPPPPPPPPPPPSPRPPLAAARQDWRRDSHRPHRVHWHLRVWSMPPEHPPPPKGGGFLLLDIRPLPPPRPHPGSHPHQGGGGPLISLRPPPPSGSMGEGIPLPLGGQGRGGGACENGRTQDQPVRVQAGDRGAFGGGGGAGWSPHVCASRGSAPHAGRAGRAVGRGFGGRPDGDVCRPLGLPG